MEKDVKFLELALYVYVDMYVCMDILKSKGASVKEFMLLKNSSLKIKNSLRIFLSILRSCLNPYTFIVKFNKTFGFCGTPLTEKTLDNSTIRSQVCREAVRASELVRVIHLFSEVKNDGTRLSRCRSPDFAEIPERGPTPESVAMVNEQFRPANHHLSGRYELLLLSQWGNWDR